MVTAARESGMKLALVLKEFNDPPTDVYDGRHWWYFICVNGDGRWYIDNAGLQIHRTIIDSISKHYSELKHTRNNKMCTDACDNLMKSANTRHFRDAPVKDCCIAFYDPDFMNRLDSKPNLIG